MKKFVSVIAALGVLFACDPEDQPDKPELVPATSISLDKISLELLVGDTETLTATIDPAGTTDILEWVSSAEEIASVADGVVTAITAGSATITATSGSVSATCEVTVKEPVLDPVDLGFEFKLADGTFYRLYWAPSNLCQRGLCAHPEDYGDYYAWGYIEPHYISRDPLTWKEGMENGYTWGNYKWAIGDKKVTKYCAEAFASQYWGGEGECDKKNFLDPEDDAAHVILGGNWRMPTSREFLQLINNCTQEWISVNGVNGIEFTGPNGNSIFFPAAGYWDGNVLFSPGSRGDYWSSYVSAASSSAQSMDIIDDEELPAWFLHANRRMGFSIRPVIQPE